MMQFSAAERENRLSALEPLDGGGSEMPGNTRDRLS